METAQARRSDRLRPGRQTCGLEFLVHAANVLYLFAFMVRDALWFRVLAVVAAGCLIPYFYFRPEPLAAPFYWKLREFMKQNPDLHSALTSTLAIDLTRWLQATWARGAGRADSDKQVMTSAR